MIHPIPNTESIYDEIELRGLRYGYLLAKCIDITEGASIELRLGSLYVVRQHAVAGAFAVFTLKYNFLCNAYKYRFDIIARDNEELMAINEQQKHTKATLKDFT